MLLRIVNFNRSMYIVHIYCFILPLLFTWNVTEAGESRLCKVYMKHSYNTEKVFHDISSFDELKRLIALNIKELLSIPEKVAYLSKLTLMLELDNYVPLESEILAYAVRLIDDIMELYRLRLSSSMKKTLENRLQFRFEEITAAIVTYSAKLNSNPYSTTDLLQCLRSNKLVIHTLDILKEKKWQWTQNYSNGHEVYKNLLSLTELVGSYLTLQPSRFCKAAIDRLVHGCVTRSSEQEYSLPLKSKELEDESSHICKNYCINVLRGCLAPPLLFLPKQNSVDSTQNELSPWDQLLGTPYSAEYIGSPIEKALHLFLESLNGTNLVTVIRTGIENALKDITNLQLKINLFCGDELHHTTPSINNDQPDPRIKSITSTAKAVQYLEEVNQKQAEVLQLVRMAGERLHRIAMTLADTVSYTTMLEKRFCVADNNSSNCWNGRTFGGYAKPAVPFTTDGQKSNPEILITEEDLRIGPPTGSDKQTSVIRVRVAEDEPRDAEQIHPGDLQSSGVSDSVLDEPIQSSGFVPSDGNILTGLKPLPDLTPKPYPNIQTVSSDRWTSGCSIDDEDCNPLNREMEQSVDFGDDHPISSTTTKQTEVAEEQLSATTKVEHVSDVKTEKDRRAYSSQSHRTTFDTKVLLLPNYIFVLQKYFF